MTNENQIREFHLFACIGGGIYGGQLLGQPTPEQAEYLLGFPLGASTIEPVSMHNYNLLKKDAGIL